MCVPSKGAHTGPSPVDRARPGSKQHLIVDRQGTPLAVSLTSGNHHDVTQLMPLLDAVPRIRGLRGRPRHRPRRLFADRGYDYDRYRRLVRARGITPKIARRGVPHGSGLGKTRWVVERTFAWLHQFKRLRIRYEIRADLHLDSRVVSVGSRAVVPAPAPDALTVEPGPPDPLRSTTHVLPVPLPHPRARSRVEAAGAESRAKAVRVSGVAPARLHYC